MTLLVNKLPFELRKQWVKEAVEIEERTRKIAEFHHLVAFVVREAKAASSLFGRRIYTTQAKT